MHFRMLGCTFLAALFCYAPAEAASDEFTYFSDTACARASRLESKVPCLERDSLEIPPIEQNVGINTSLEYFAVPTRHCQAVVTLDYKQVDALASIEGEVSNDTCGASSGSLVLSVRTRHDSGEETSQEYMQSWMREDDQPVTFSAEYPIGDDLDLMVVRAQRVRCTCSEAPP